MLILRKLVTLTLLFALMATSLQGQDPDTGMNDNSDENTASAYQESVHAAHWSIYIPIGIYVAAAIFLGIADTKHSQYFSHSRSDALGPAGSSSYSPETSSSGMSATFSH